MSWPAPDMRIRPISRFEVPGVRLDDVLRSGPPVDLLRMDAEGSEPLVLKGAEELLRRSPRMRIMMEFSPIMMGARVDVPAFTGWLATFGFKAWRVTPSGALAKVAMADLPKAPHCEIVLSRDAPPGALTIGAAFSSRVDSLRRDRSLGPNSCMKHPLAPADRSSSTSSSPRAFEDLLRSRRIVSGRARRHA